MMKNVKFSDIFELIPVYQKNFYEDSEFSHEDEDSKFSHEDEGEGEDSKFSREEEGEGDLQGDVFDGGHPDFGGGCGVL